VNAVGCTSVDGIPVAVTGGGGFGGEVLVWDLRTGQRRATLTGHTQPVNAVACTSVDGIPVAVTGGGDSGVDGRRVGGGEVMVWDLRAYRTQDSLIAPYPVTALACDADGGIVIGAGSEVIRLQHARLLAV
jgi:WD40 repeat protein